MRLIKQESKFIRK